MPVRRKKAWWNKPQKGIWMPGCVVGLAVGAFITSSFLRWAVISLSILGLILALIFRVRRSDDEI
jgi:hypothetical protein